MTTPSVDLTAFVRLALDCVHREYPNHLRHLMNDDGDARPPRELTPAFYGCFDWHSAVHGHWLLARAARLQPTGALAAEARAALERSLTLDNLAAEVTYFNAAGRTGFERPYGLAWLLTLALELREWASGASRRPEGATTGVTIDEAAARWSAALVQLEEIVAERLVSHASVLTHPVRSGEHSQTAFSLGLALDWARGTGRDDLRERLAARARHLFERDVDAPITYEPSGEDFLSPSLAEADVMRRVLGRGEFAAWLARFLPDLPSERGAWLSPVASPDPSDGRLSHLDGLCLSRAWMLEGIASALPEHDGRRTALLAAASEHAAIGLKAIGDRHYAGAHWLGTFATYLLTRRGL